MLGKRSRAMHSAASFSHMDLHLDAVSIDATPSQRPQLSDRFSKPQPAPIPQVVGFNLAPKCSHSPGQFNPCLGSDQQPPFAYLQTSVVSSRPPVSPRSALQTLLAATRQVVIMPMDNSSSMVSPLLEAGEENQGTAIPKPSQQSSTLASKLQTKTETKGIDSAVVSSHHRKFLQHSNETSQVNHAMPGYPYSKAHIGRREITSVEGKGKLADSPHFLFLATSPLVDASTVVTPKNNFLDSCYLCRRPLGHGLDIFIYRGDKAFCSIGCRDEQILMDEWKERGSSSMLRSGSAVAA